MERTHTTLLIAGIVEVSMIVSRFNFLVNCQESAMQSAAYSYTVSDLLDLELINAIKKVRNLLQQYPSDKFERTELDEESFNLADK